MDDPLGENSARDDSLPLLLNAYVQVAIEGHPLKGVVAIPATGLREGNKVWIIAADGKLEIRPVTVAWVEEGRVLIGAGLSAGETVVTSPHKVYGPQNNDLVLQLRKRGIDRVMLAGMSGNLCVESHLRDLLEQGFEVAVVTDATASAILPDWDGNADAMTSFRFIANATWTTEEAVATMTGN